MRTYNQITQQKGGMCLCQIIQVKILKTAWDFSVCDSDKIM